MAFGGLTPRLDGNVNEYCVAEWRENGPKCAVWKKDVEDCCCEPPEIKVKLPPPPEEHFIRLQFKFAIDFDTFTPKAGTNGVNAARYKIKEITDEEAYEANLFGIADMKTDRAEELPSGVSEQEDSMDAYYQSLECGSWKWDPDDIVPSTWQSKKEAYGDVLLICKELWWHEKMIGGEREYGFCENDACYSRVSKSERDRLRYTHTEGPMLIPACYGLPDFRGTEFEEPKWQRSEPDGQCYPPHKNEYTKVETDITEDPTYTLGRTYQIFWHGSGGRLSDLTALNIKAGTGDNPGGTVCVPNRDENGDIIQNDPNTPENESETCFDVPVTDAIYWNAIPNEEYELTIRHDLYRFPDFYRTDEKDHYGNFKGNLLSGPPELRDADGNRIEYVDIRDVPFQNISKGNLSIHAQTPYVAGCDCTQFIPISQEGDGINNDPLADINLNYLAGIKGSMMTKTIIINSSETDHLAFCGSGDFIRTIGFDKIEPMTTFGVNGKNFNEWILNSEGKDWADYIKEGQYSVFHVSFKPASDPDHPNNDTNVSCYDQASYSFAFALNLKDHLSAGIPDNESDPKCYTGYGQEGNTVPVNRAIKLYYMARSSGTEIEYPGELRVLNDDYELDTPPQKQCLLLDGQAWKTSGHIFAPPDRLKLPVPVSSYDWGIGYTQDGALRLGSDFDFGHDHFRVSQDGDRGPGLTLLAEILEACPRLTDHTEESTLETVINLHLDLGHLYEANVISAGRAHAWSHFGSDNPEQL